MKYILLILFFTSTAKAVDLNYLYNGNPVPLRIDTVTPSKSKGLPNSPLNTSGVMINPATFEAQASGDTSLASIDVKQSTIIAYAASMDTKTNLNYGVATGAIRTASQLGNASGIADFGSGASSSQTLRVVLATDAAAIKVAPAASGQQVTGTVTTASAVSISPPANTTGFILESSSSSPGNMRYKVGGTATISSGMRLEPGRSEYLPINAALSVIAETASAEYQVQWILSQ